MVTGLASYLCLVRRISVGSKQLTWDIFSSLPDDNSHAEGKGTVIAQVMSCKLALEGEQHSSSNKHKTKKVAQVLLDSGSDGDLLLHQKSKTILFLSLKRWVPYSWHTLNGIFQAAKWAEAEQNFYDYLDNKRFFVKLVSSTKEISHSMTSFWAASPWKS